MAPQPMALGELLDQLTMPGTLYERLSDNAVRCVACGHRCLIKDERAGICRVRFNRGGTPYVPHGYVAALQVDPTEKKPFFHILPGSNTLTFGMLGCNMHCACCQNWLTSQALRDDQAGVAPPPSDVPAFIPTPDSAPVESPPASPSAPRLGGRFSARCGFLCSGCAMNPFPSP
jgi:hypothetical protein